MKRVCSQCQKPFTAAELARSDSKTLEKERREHGVRGLHFHCYHCEACGHDEIFLDIQKLENESEEAFEKRRRELEVMARQMHGEHVEVVVMSR